MTHTSSDVNQPEPADINMIRQIINDVQEGFNTNDPDLMNTHLADDAVVVNARGAVLTGRRCMLHA